ncbi:MAG: hypothetical protein ACR2OU_04260 [Thermomicrobiales bacterium]
MNEPGIDAAIDRRRSHGARNSVLRSGNGWGRILMVAAIMLAAPWWGLQASAHEATPMATPTADGECGNGSTATWSNQMKAYASAGAYPAIQTNVDGRPSTVLVEIPKISFTGAGESATLPVGPCQNIYRFAYSDVQSEAVEPGPFAYAEIDWNTEGLPRGPNGSFASPHFDFHFYMLPRADVEQQMTCVSTNGRTCDPLKTDYEQTKLFEDLPDVTFVPPPYRADPGSAIPAMGLHLLDTDFDYTLDNVNHYPTLIYGTFGGKVVFAEASVTLYTLQDAVNSPDHRISFPFRQPEAFATSINWPTEFVIEYLPATGGFQAGFVGFEHH